MEVECGSVENFPLFILRVVVGSERSFFTLIRCRCFLVGGVGAGWLLLYSVLFFRVFSCLVGKRRHL
jgi:hypothetical protein